MEELPKLRKPAAALLLGAAVMSSTLFAAVNIPLDSWVYPAIDTLEAAGLIDTGHLGLRPFSRRKAARLVLEAQGIAEQRGDGRFAGLLDRLRREFAFETAELEAGTAMNYFRPAHDAYLAYTVINSASPPENRAGRPYAEGANIHTGFSLDFQKAPFSGRLRWELHWLEGKGDAPADVSSRFEEASLKITRGRWFTEIGRQSLWWGPGRHGSLLLSNNAPPFDLLRIAAEDPFMLPGVFSKLGLITAEMFITRLEKERFVPEPYLMGMRLTAKPTQNLEIGLHRTIMFGGEGRDVTWKTLWDLLLAIGENEPDGPGNQLASAYWRYRVPHPTAPFEFYGEFGGEDHTDPAYFTRPALIAGLYFPAIGPVGRLDLRLEYADTYMGGHQGNKRVWYTHGIYRSGYTYKGHIIGHHAGTDARDWYLELGCRAGENARLWLAADAEVRELYEPFPEERFQLSLGAEWRPSAETSVAASYMREWIRNYEYTEGEKRSGGRFELAARIQF